MNTTASAPYWDVLQDIVFQLKSIGSVRACIDGTECFEPLDYKAYAGHAQWREMLFYYLMGNSTHEIIEEHFLQQDISKVKTLEINGECGKHKCLEKASSLDCFGYYCVFTHTIHIPGHHAYWLKSWACENFMACTPDKLLLQERALNTSICNVQNRYWCLRWFCMSSCLHETYQCTQCDAAISGVSC